MKRILFALLIGITFIAASCSEEEKGEDPANYSGSIYGIVTDFQTAEPLRAVGVELYADYYANSDEPSLLLKTVTFDDGHFEFDDLTPYSYKLVIKAEDYEEAEYTVTVEPGRTARADMQISKLQTHLTVITLEVENSEDGMLTFNGTFNYSNGYFPDEVGFIYGQSESLDENNGTLIKADVNSSPFSCTVSTEELKTGTWYVRAFAKNKGGYELGQVRMFEIKLPPIVQTLEATNISETTATLNGLIVYKGEPEYTEKGFVYSSSFPMPTLDDPDNATTKVSVSGNSDEFSANISGLVKDQTYRVRAYAKSNDGVVYGDAVSFETTAQPYIILENMAIQLTDLSRSGVTIGVADDLCSNSRVGGFSDWRLPTVAELVLIYENRAKIGGFQSRHYWTSSTKWDYKTLYVTVDFSTGEVDNLDYSEVCCVRAVRTVK